MRKFAFSSSYKLLVLLSAVAISISACSFNRFPVSTEACNIRTYVDAGALDYVSSRYHGQYPVRLGIVPFDVPETFAPAGNESQHFGRELAKNVYDEVVETGEFAIVELFNRDRWPGKRAEFFAGNYGAVKRAKAAGYDLVLVGYLEEIKNDSDLEIYTKLIDTRERVTLWYGKTTVSSSARFLRRELSKAWLVQDRPELFAFTERVEQFADCTVDAILEQ